MGLFSWLFGARKPERVTVTDRVWLTTVNRSTAIVKELTAHISAKQSVLCLAHFPSTLAALAPELIEAALPHEAIPDSLSPHEALQLAAKSPPRVLFGLVRNLKPDEFPADDLPNSPLPVVLAERHFLRDHDECVTKFAEGLGLHAAITVHMALDDELMRIFAGEWVADTLRSLGVQPDEAIESGMVARRIRKAQDQIRGMLAEEDEPADSPAEWMQKNVRS